MKRLRVIIKDCLDCPYCNSNKCHREYCKEPVVYTCDHPGSMKYKYLEQIDGGLIDVPDWCPLEEHKENERMIIMQDVGEAKPPIFILDDEEMYGE